MSIITIIRFSIVIILIIIISCNMNNINIVFSLHFVLSSGLDLASEVVFPQNVKISYYNVLRWFIMKV